MAGALDFAHLLRRRQVVVQFGVYSTLTINCNDVEHVILSPHVDTFNVAGALLVLALRSAAYQYSTQRVCAASSLSVNLFRQSARRKLT